jgi:mannose-6-phosphate isomerase-like protein (cupin superfamily)
MESGPGPFVALPGDGLALPFIGTLKATGGQTRGSFELIEYSGPAGPPPHVHHEHDEGFFILDGSFSFVLGTKEFEAPQGSFVFVPRGTRHGFVPTAGARALLFIVPSGLEGFFRDLGEGLAAGRSETEIRAALAGRYDSEPVA